MESMRSLEEGVELCMGLTAADHATPDRNIRAVGRECAKAALTQWFTIPAPPGIEQGMDTTAVRQSQTES